MHSRASLTVLVLLSFSNTTLATSGSKNTCSPPPTDPTADGFDWLSVSPYPSLKWVKCYDTFKCARLEVPLDYAKPHAEKAAIALLKFPSKYQPKDKKWKGPIIYNPGGPGESGVDMVHRLGADFSKLIGDDYDHVGFDPRGVGRTTPVFNLFPTQVEKKLWDAAMPGLVNATSDALARHFARARIFATLSEDRAKGVAPYMSAPTVARDMLEITKAHGLNKLQYWGVSYGTALGMTFASLFPDNVGRIIVDGVVDADNYFSTAPSNNLEDTDKTFDYLCDACAASSACPLREKTGKETRQRIERLFNSLKEQPIPVVNGSNYGLADVNLAKGVLFHSLYAPFSNFPPVTQALADLEKGNGVTLFEVAGVADSQWRCNCAGEPFPPQLGQLEPTVAIGCVDIGPQDKDFKTLVQDVNKMTEQSFFADVWTNLFAFRSGGWKIKPAVPLPTTFGGNTSFPVLFIGNTLDPATPLSAAKKMSTRFNKAVLLTQKSPGHASLAQPSLCTAGHVRAYFRDGVLPPQGTECAGEGGVFPSDGSTGVTARDLELSEGDVSILEAVKALSKRYRPPTLRR